MCAYHFEYVNQFIQNDLKHVFNYDLLNSGPAKSHNKEKPIGCNTRNVNGHRTDKMSNKTFSHISRKQVAMQ